MLVNVRNKCENASPIAFIPPPWGRGSGRSLSGWYLALIIPCWKRIQAAIAKEFPFDYTGQRPPTPTPKIIEAPVPKNNTTPTPTYKGNSDPANPTTAPKTNKGKKGGARLGAPDSRDLAWRAYNERTKKIQDRADKAERIQRAKATAKIGRKLESQESKTSPLLRFIRGIDYYPSKRGASQLAEIMSDSTGTAPAMARVKAAKTILGWTDGKRSKPQRPRRRADPDRKAEGPGP